MLRRKFGGPRVAAAKAPTATPAASSSATTTTTTAVSAPPQAPTPTAPPVAALPISEPERQVTPQPRCVTPVSPVAERLPTPAPLEASPPPLKAVESVVAIDEPEYSAPTKRKRKVFDKNMELNTSTMTMADLVDWRPNTENTLRKKWREAEKKYKEEGFTAKTEKVETPTQELGPRVKVDEDGNIVIDEDSLVVRRKPEDITFEAVDDDLMPKKINSLSFRKNYSRTAAWTNLETDLFYEVLAATGTDFSLMHNYLPFKSRADIKKKFCKEEKVNLRRINETLSKPALLDDEVVKMRVDRLMLLIDKETEKKKAANEKKELAKKRRSRNNASVSTETSAVETKNCVEEE